MKVRPPFGFDVVGLGGNPAKGLDPGTGPGSGDWRLELESDLDVEVLAYVRTPAGFLASMHEAAPAGDDGRHRLNLFNAADIWALRVVYGSSIRDMGPSRQRSLESTMKGWTPTRSSSPSRLGLPER